MVPSLGNQPGSTIHTVFCLLHATAPSEHNSLAREALLCSVLSCPPLVLLCSCSPTAQQPRAPAEQADKPTFSSRLRCLCSPGFSLWDSGGLRIEYTVPYYNIRSIGDPIQWGLETAEFGLDQQTPFFEKHSIVPGLGIYSTMTVLTV